MPKNHFDDGDCNSSSYERWYEPESGRASVKATLTNTKFMTLPYDEKAVNEQVTTILDL